MPPTNETRLRSQPRENRSQYLARRFERVAHLSAIPLADEEIRSRLQPYYDYLDRTLGYTHIGYFNFSLYSPNPEDPSDVDWYTLSGHIGRDHKIHSLRIIPPCEFEEDEEYLTEFYHSDLTPGEPASVRHDFDNVYLEGLGGPNSERAMKPTEDLLDRLFPQAESSIAA